MDCKELMIGDIVMFKHQNYPTRIKVIDNTHCMPFEDMKVSGWVKYGGLEDIEPIPLTPEILEKNGWEKKGSPYEWRDNIWVQKWNLPIDAGNFQILDCPRYDGFTWNNVELNFVHTLQHALRLCGLNELANNFKVE